MNCCPRGVCAHLDGNIIQVFGIVLYYGLNRAEINIFEGIVSGKDRYMWEAHQEKSA